MFNGTINYQDKRIKLYKENGLLNDAGKDALDEHLNPGLELLLSSEETVQGLYAFKAVLTKYVGDKISERIHKLESQEK